MSTYGIKAFALLALVTMFGCQKPTSAVAERRDIVGYETLASELVTPAPARAEVLAPYQAPVQRMMVTVGARVRRGEVLMELSLPNAQAAFEGAKLNFKNAQAALAQADREYSQSVKLWQEKVKSLRAARDRGEVIDDAELVNAERSLADSIASRNASIEPYRESLRQAQQYLTDTQSGAKLASIRATISGTVIALDAASGQEVGADRTKSVATIVDLEALLVQAIIDGKVAVEVGDEFAISFAELPNQGFVGRVSKIITIAGSNERRAVIDFENEKGLVKPGMKSAASIKTGEVKNAIAVPFAAVDTDASGKPIVNVLKGSDWTPVVVTVGLSGNGYTEIKSGIAEGDTVQVTP